MASNEIPMSTLARKEIKLAPRKRCRLGRTALLAHPIKAQKHQVPWVMWVGISDKPATSPLASNTATGRVVAEMERALEGLRFHRTNLVRHAPMDDDGRLRYPTREEMIEGADSLLLELERVQPRIVVTLGAAVSKVVVERVARTGRFAGLGNSFRYAPRHGETFFVLPVHHPSFVLIYRRKKLRAYIQAICRWIAEIIHSLEAFGPGIPRTSQVAWLTATKGTADESLAWAKPGRSRAEPSLLSLSLRCIERWASVKSTCSKERAAVRLKDECRGGWPAALL